MYSNGKFKIQLEGKDKQLKTFELSEDQAKKFIEGKDKESIYQEINKMESNNEKKMKMKNVARANSNNYDEVQEKLADYSSGLGYMHGKLEGVTQSKKHWYNIEKTTYKNGEKLANVVQGEELEEIKDIVNRANNIGSRFYKERNAEKIRSYAEGLEDSSSNTLTKSNNDSVNVNIYKKGQDKSLENEKALELEDDDKTLVDPDENLNVNIYKKEQSESLDSVKLFQKLEKLIESREAGKSIPNGNNNVGIKKGKGKEL